MPDRINVRPAARLLALAFTLVLLTGPALAEEEATATLPLKEILELHRKVDTREDEPERAPVAAALQKLEIRGRVLDSGLDLNAHFEVVVLESDHWVKLPLIPLREESSISELPLVPDGAFAVENGQLVFLTRKDGRYAFDVALFRKARHEGDLRRVELAQSGAAMSSVQLEIDAGLFELASANVIDARSGVLVLPQGDVFPVAWRVRQDVASEPAAVVAAPAIESVVRRVDVSTVSTLEGRRITRVLYDLRFAGRKTLSITLPEGHSLERVFLNGVGVPNRPEGRTLEIEVAPARAGEEGGTLELVLSSRGGIFNLAGRLHFDLPSVSWPTHELALTLHLPRVFEYTWSGGSLEPATKAPRAEFTYRMPEPGKKLRFDQVLIDERAPDLDLEYEVDLTGHYFQDARQAAAQCSGDCGSY